MSTEDQGVPVNSSDRSRATTSAETSRSSRPQGTKARRARPVRPARARRRRRNWRERLQSENLRLILSMGAGLASMTALVLLVPQTNYVIREENEDRAFALLLLLIAFLIIYSAVITTLTYLALREQPRSRLIALARLGHARRHVALYKYLVGRSGPVGEVLQLMGTTVVAIVLLALRPPDFAVALLLAITAAALVCTWISTVLTFALEYAAEDARGDAFAFPGTPPAERLLEEYLYAAVVIQAAPGPSGVEPISRDARRKVRTHVIIAHTTSTIIITLAVSVVITALT